MAKSSFYISLYNWYDANKRILPWRETNDPYLIWISEIILQQTRVAQGLSYYHNFIHHFPNISSLAHATEEQVLNCWQGLGYYSRARNLHKAAQLLKDHFPTTFDQIRALPGIGEYTAGAIMSFAFNMPYPAIDGNVYRVLARLYDSEVIFDTYSGKKHFHQLANQLMDRENPRLFNSAIMEFGALYCTPLSPECSTCPIQNHCLAYAHNTVELLPLRKKKNALKDRYLNYIIYLCKSDSTYQTLIHQRNDDDIWKHLWEFPMVESMDSLLDIQTIENRLLPTSCIFEHHILAQRDFKHILSHQRLHARFIIQSVSSLPSIEHCKTISIDELSNYPLSRLNEKAVEFLYTFL